MPGGSNPMLDWPSALDDQQTVASSHSGEMAATLGIVPGSMASGSMGAGLYRGISTGEIRFGDLDSQSGQRWSSSLVDRAPMGRVLGSQSFGSQSQLMMMSASQDAMRRVRSRQSGGSLDEHASFPPGMARPQEHLGAPISPSRGGESVRTPVMPSDLARQVANAQQRHLANSPAVPASVETVQLQQLVVHLLQQAPLFQLYHTVLQFPYVMQYMPPNKRVQLQIYSQNQCNSAAQSPQASSPMTGGDTSASESGDSTATLTPGSLKRARITLTDETADEADPNAEDSGAPNAGSKPSDDETDRDDEHRSNWIDITEYLNLPQVQAASILGVPSSTLSKRWKEVARGRKWPWRSVRKIDRSLASLITNLDRSKPVEASVQEQIADLMSKRADLLSAAYIRL